MKRLITMSALTSGVLVAGGLGLVSCNDDLDIAASGVHDQAAWMSDEEYPICYSGFEIWNVDTLQACDIKLNTVLPLEVKNANPYFSYELSKDETGRPVLRPHLSGVMETIDELTSDQLHLTVKGHPEMGEKVVNLFVHPVQKQVSRAVESDDLKDKIRNRASDVFDYAINFRMGTARQAANKIFDFGDQYQDVFHGILNINTISDVPSTYTEHTFHSVKESMVQWDFGVDITGKFPLATGLLNGSLAYKNTTVDKSRDVMETFVAKQVERAANLNLNWNSMIEIDPTTNLPYYYAYLKKDFYRALNDPSSEVYKKYNKNSKDKTDLDGVCRLMQDYGSFYTLQAVLGGRGMFTYQREEHETEHSMTWDLNMAADWAGAFPDILGDAEKAKKLTQLKGLVEDKHKNSDKEKSELSAKVHLGKKERDFVNEVTSNITFHFEGGEKKGSNDKKLNWDLDRKNPGEWVIIDYKNDEQAMSDAMIPLYNFIADQESPRAKLVKEALTGRTYKVGDSAKDTIYTTPFYHYLDSTDGFLVLKHPRLVLADVTVVTSRGADDPWEPVVMEGPDKKKRTYYPMRANCWSPDKDYINYAIHTDVNAFIGGGLNILFDHFSGALHKQLWYYALDYEDQCQGIVDIQFFKEGKQPREYFRNEDGGCSNKDGMTCGGGTEERYLYVKLAPEGTSYADKIKAVGLYCIKCKDDESLVDRVFASTPFKYELAKYPNQNQKFYHYWFWYKEAKEKGHITDGEFQDTGIAYTQPTRFKMVWTLEPLNEIRSYYKTDGESNSADAFKDSLPKRRGE